MTHRRQSRWLVVVLVAVLCLPPLGLGGAPLAAGAADGRMLSLAEAVPVDAWFFAAMTLDRGGPQAVLADQRLDRAGIGGLVDQSMATDPSWAAMERDLVAYDAFLYRDMAVFVTPQAIAGQLNAATSTPAAGVGLIVRVADPAAAASLMASLSAKATSRIVHRAVTVSVEPPSASSSGSAWALLNDLVVVGVAPADVFGVVDVVRGSAPSLAARPAFGAATAVLPGALLAAGFYDVDPLREQIADLAVASAPGLGDQGLADLDLSLLPGARGGFGFWAEPTGFRLAFTSPAAGMRGPRPVGADLASATSVLMATGRDLGANRAWAAWLAAADRYAAAFGSPGFASALKAQLGFDPVEDFLARLTGDWVVAVNLQLLAAPPIAVSFVSGTDDPARLASTLDKIAGLVAEQARQGPRTGAATVDRAGASVHRVVTPYDSGGGMVSVEFGVVGNRAALTVGRPLDAALRPAAQPLTTNPRYQAAMAALPADHSAELFVDVASLLQVANFAAAGSSTPLPANLRVDAFASVATVRDDMLVAEAVLTIPE